MSELRIGKTKEELYGGQPLGFGKSKTGQQWLAEFRKDLSSIVEALDVWQQIAADISCEAMSRNSSPGSRLTVPWWFQNLTRIIALWSDVELHIDAAPLCEFRAKMLDLVPRSRLMPGGNVGTYRGTMTDREIEACLSTARETFDRVFHATLARASEKQQTPATANDARDEWIYGLAMKTVAWGTIARRLKKKPKSWKRIGTDNGVRKAAIAYAERHELPMPPTRKAGRPKQRNTN